MKKYTAVYRKLRSPKTLLTLATVLILILVTLLPSFNQTLGNLFFGKVPKLYNVTLAQFFFTQSAYPLLGKAAPYAHHQLSRTNFIQGDLKRAIEEAQKELELYPGHKQAYYVLALTYGYLNEEQKAIDSFTKFIEWKPKSWAARNDKAWLQFRIGDIDGALLTITPVAQDINNPWVQNTYGTLLMNKKRYPEAQAAFESAKKTAAQMSEELWGMAYPGNDPRIYATGLSAMRLSIQNNLKLLEERSTGGK